MTKKEIIEIAQALGFHLDYDQFDIKGKKWMRFRLKDSLDEQDLRWVWYGSLGLLDNLNRAGQILFKAGQKAFKLRLNEYIDL